MVAVNTNGQVNSEHLKDEVSTVFFQCIAAYKEINMLGKAKGFCAFWTMMDNQTNE